MLIMIRQSQYDHGDELVSANLDLFNCLADATQKGMENHHLLITFKQVVHKSIITN